MIRQCFKPFVNILSIKNKRLQLKFLNKAHTNKKYLINSFTYNIVNIKKFNNILNKDSNNSLLNQKIVYEFCSSPKTDKQFQQQSQKFYQNYVQQIIQLQNQKDFQFILGNIAQPIVIDFYADWCQPCKQLTPILEQRIKESKGGIKLLKINIDKCGELAHQLKITSVPTVFGVFRGQGIDSFQGLPEKPKIDKFFETLMKMAQIANSQGKAYQILNKGKELLAAQKYAQAQKVFLQFNEKGVDDQFIAVKQSLLAQCYLSQNKIAKLKDQIQRMKKYQKQYTQNAQLSDFYHLLLKQSSRLSQLASQNPQIFQLKSQISQDPKNLTLKYKLYEVYKKNQMIEQGLEQLIQILKIDKNWEERKSNKELLAVFKELGNTSPITQKYRKLMQRVLN